MGCAQGTRELWRDELHAKGGRELQRSRLQRGCGSEVCTGCLHSGCGRVFPRACGRPSLSCRDSVRARARATVRRRRGALSAHACALRACAARTSVGGRTQARLKEEYQRMEAKLLAMEAKLSGGKSVGGGKGAGQATEQPASLNGSRPR